MSDTRTIEELRSKWQRERPFYYSLDHDGVGILLEEIQRLQSALDDANARAMRFANRMDDAGEPSNTTTLKGSNQK